MVKNWQKVILVCFSAMMFCLAGYPVEAQTAKHLVIIDPSHGGNDTGVIGVDDVAEKDITLALSLALQKELVKEGHIEVVLTRNTDKSLSVEERKKMIAKLNPSMVLSLHANAGFGKTSSGYELYYPGFNQEESVSKTGKPDNVKNPSRKHLNDTVKLARLLQRNLDALFPRKNRGLREAGVPLAEGLSVPVLIVELGFVTNPDEKKKLTSVKTQTDIARALARSIKAFF